MGLRYRKSINLGGGFRINLSKSGVGYSWGVKGYRVTKTANGRVRTTASIPGTGLSYVSERGGKKKKQEPQPVQQPVATYGAETYENANAGQISSAAVADILKAARKTSVLNVVLIICAILFFGGSSESLFSLIGTVACVALLVYVRTQGTVELEYSLDDDETQALWNSRMSKLSAVASSEKLWRVVESAKVADQKKSGGATRALRRVPCKAAYKLPFPFRSNVNPVAFVSGKEKLYFLPDMVLIKQGLKLGALTYDDFSYKFGASSFIEDEKVPGDATVIGQTWKYVNKSGGPDNRFKDNRQIPVCRYGTLEAVGAGLNTVIMFSKAL